MTGKSLLLEKTLTKLFTGFHLLYSERPKYPTVEERGRGRRDLIDHGLETQMVIIAQLHIQTFLRIKLFKRSKTPKHKPVGQATPSSPCCCWSFPRFCHPLKFFLEGGPGTWWPLCHHSIISSHGVAKAAFKEAPAQRGASAILASSTCPRIQNLTLPPSSCCWTLKEEPFLSYRMAAWCSAPAAAPSLSRQGRTCASRAPWKTFLR